jgi:hypothetical protein
VARPQAQLAGRLSAASRASKHSTAASCTQHDRCDRTVPIVQVAPGGVFRDELLHNSRFCVAPAILPASPWTGGGPRGAPAAPPALQVL